MLLRLRTLIIYSTDIYAETGQSDDSHFDTEIKLDGVLDMLHDLIRLKHLVLGCSLVFYTIG
jgi:hypothetical protein